MKEIYASSVKLDGRKGLSGTNRRKKWVDRAYSAAAKWNAVFGRVEIEGSPEAKTNFYSSLYRLFIQPNNIADAVEMIRKMACSGISSSDVVDFIGEPRRTAEAHFREVTGRSIHEEIDEIRFAKVFELLKNPRQSLDSLPDLCGFKTGVALRKAFSLRTGMSMRDWRKRELF